jgi:hypothetical protein
MGKVFCEKEAVHKLERASTASTMRFISRFLPDEGQNTPNQPLSFEIEIGLQDARFPVGSNALQDVLVVPAEVT